MQANNPDKLKVFEDFLRECASLTNRIWWLAVIFMLIVIAAKLFGFWDLFWHN